MKRLILKPHITEKTIELTKKGKFTFLVSTQARKEEIIKRVEKMFNVTVEDIKTLKNAGKVKNSRTKRRQGTYQKKGIKKALVSLKKGQKIELFDLENKEQ